MARWSFTCAAGHSHGPFSSEDEARYYAGGMDAECSPVDPAKVTAYDFDAPVAMFVAKPEIEPHFNRSLGQHVESRKHLEHLQAKHGCSDVVVKEGTPDWVPRDLNETAKRMNAIAESGEVNGAKFVDLP